MSVFTQSQIKSHDSNDKEEHDRLSYQHEAIKLAVGGNYKAPISQLNEGKGPLNILDVCSGSGQWVLEMAHEFPEAKVYGIDVSKPAAKPQNTSPSNAWFVIRDIRLPFEECSFDVVHMRMVPSIQERETIYKDIHRVLRPGGLILLVEPGERVSHTGADLPPELVAMTNAVVGTRHFQEIKYPAPDRARTGSQENAWAMATKIGEGIRKSPSMWAKVEEVKLAIPIGDWADDDIGQRAGKLLRYCIPGLFKAMRPAIVDEGILSGEQMDDLLGKLDIVFGPEAARWKIEWPFCLVWAEKI
ncbi:methyltransferase domain protein [Ceratobasidium sp. AG-Ba]|nr:methyltransferase domain protein [Ceratobasidium sp. AG-Ba]